MRRAAASNTLMSDGSDDCPRRARNAGLDGVAERSADSLRSLTDRRSLRSRFLTVQVVGGHHAGLAFVAALSRTPAAAAGHESFRCPSARHNNR